MAKTVVKWTRLTPQEVERVKKAAKLLSKSLSAFIHEAVVHYLAELGI